MLKLKNTVLWGRNGRITPFGLAGASRPEMCVNRDTAVAEVSIALLLLYKILPIYFHFKSAYWTVKGWDET